MGYSFLTRRPQLVICSSLETHTRSSKKPSKLESIYFENGNLLFRYGKAKTELLKMCLNGAYKTRVSYK